MRFLTPRLRHEHHVFVKIMAKFDSYMDISIEQTNTTLIRNQDASDNVISGNEPSSDMLTGQSKNLE